MIRDEAAFLRENLLYHSRLGVSKAYVFLDRCTDQSEAIARSFPCVETLSRDRNPDDQFLSAHQIKRMVEALELARRDGIEWLLHLDADEFASGDDAPPRAGLRGDIGEAEAAAYLPRMLARQPAEAETVVLQPWEALTTPLRNGDPFFKLHYFQSDRPPVRRVLDPADGRVHRLRRLMGHERGKSIVRTAADVRPSSAHRWVRSDGKEVTAVRSGFHYHFVITGFDQWRRKYRKLAEYPSRWQNGTAVNFPKQAWKEASAQQREPEARRYFDRWVATPRRRLWLPVLRGDVVRDAFVERVIEAAQAEA